MQRDSKRLSPQRDGLGQDSGSGEGEGWGPELLQVIHPKKEGAVAWTLGSERAGDLGAWTPGSEGGSWRSGLLGLMEEGTGDPGFLEELGVGSPGFEELAGVQNS